MSKIIILDPHEAQKIAAGEVVERPANIVKELIENAIDAQATNISLYLYHGGKERIRIIDNGCGMNQEDAQLCVLKHATSKISSIAQLESLQTFGFRGEALASIAAVARFTLRTKEEQALSGTQIIAADGKLTTSVVSCNRGTEIIVEDLFYNVPARKKFLKSETTELRHIQQLMHAFCLIQLHVHFKLYSDDNLLLNCPPAHNYLERVTQVWPQQKSNFIVLPTTTHHNITLEGVIGDQHYHHYDRSNIFISVNRRWIKNQTLGTALIKGYQNMLPQGKFPFALLHITLPPDQVDINVHPRKEEVRFLHPKSIENYIQNQVKQQLEQYISNRLTAPSGLSFSSSSTPAYQHPITAPKPLYQNPVTIEHIAQLGTPVPLVFPQQSHELLLSGAQHQNIVDTSAHFQQGNAFAAPQLSTHSIIGQYKKTYILIEQEDGLLFVDQHAAHERILYELFKAEKEQNAVTLLFPHIITLPSAQLQLLQPYIPLLHRYGIIAEPFGNDTLIINALAPCLKEIDSQEIIKYFVHEIQSADQLESKDVHEALSHKLIAQLACKGAVKAGDLLSIEKMEQLLQDLNHTPSRFCCPHGRPTTWLLKLTELERTFKRI